MKKKMRQLFKLLILSLALFLSVPLYAQLTPETALQSYLDNGDNSFHWEIADKIKVQGVTGYRLVFTSQKWQNIEWKHEMVVIVPARLRHEEALLFINGGSNEENGDPNLHKWDEGMTKVLAKMAKQNNAVTAVLWQVPNQPLYDGLKEDALISYTLHQYRKDGDFSWPLLFPMTKSAVKAMDVVQQLTKEKGRKKVTGFVLSGGSKLGWTTWLSGASDSRVKAIAPMVIDMLNMPVSMAYQIETWGDYSVQIEDYVKLGIVQNIEDPKGAEIVTMIDPYAYRSKLTMPKMIFFGTNDEYWPVDAVKNYIADIPGDNHLHYVPNAGHGLGDKKQALNALNAFFAINLAGRKVPPCESRLMERDDKMEMTIHTASDQLKEAVLWTAMSDDKDFRNETWTSEKLSLPGNADPVKLEISYPASGYKAFYVELIHAAPKGDPYSQSTRMFVADSTHFLK